MKITFSTEPCSVPGCGKPAQMWFNVAANCASTVLPNMQPFCDEHNPLRLHIDTLHVVEEWYDHQHKQTE